MHREAVGIAWNPADNRRVPEKEAVRGARRRGLASDNGHQLLLMKGLVSPESEQEAKNGEDDEENKNP